MDFITGLLMSTDWKDNSYDSILVKVTINRPRLVEVIIDMVVYYHGVPESIVMDQSLLFKSKF